MTHRWTRIGSLLLVLCLALFGSFASAQPLPTELEMLPVPLTELEGDYRPGELLVKFRAGVASTMQAERMAQVPATHIRTLYENPVHLYSVPVGQELEIAAQLMADPAIEYAEPNHVYRVFLDPNDPYLSDQWAHTVIRSRQAWNLSTGSAAVTIAIIDSGVDESHPDLSGKLVPGYDFWDYDTNPHDENGHGTHVAAIAAASTNNGTGVAGVSWGAKIMPIRTQNAAGSGYTADIVDGINWARTHGAKVINLSLGGINYNQSMQDAVTAAYNAGLLVVAAMGNCRTGCQIGTDHYVNPINYPAAYNNVLAVASTGPSDVYSYFSQYGSHCDLAAPGGNMAYLHDPAGILSAMPTYDVFLTDVYGYSNDYDYMHGTSQATPHVAGLAALIWSVDPALSPYQVQSIMQDTAVDLGALGKDDDYGYGRIDAMAALSNLQLPVTDLRITSAITNTGTLTATLAWTPPTNAVTVAVRYAAQPITKGNWFSAALLKDDLPGTAHTYTATVPYTDTGTTAFFALRWQDVNDRWADPSNLAFWPSQPVYLPVVSRP